MCHVPKGVWSVCVLPNSACWACLGCRLAVAGLGEFWAFWNFLPWGVCVSLPSGVDRGWPAPWESLTLPDLLVIFIFEVHLKLCLKGMYVKCSYHTLKKSEKNKQIKQKHRGTQESLGCIRHVSSLDRGVGIRSVCVYPSSSEGKYEMHPMLCRLR